MAGRKTEFKTSSHNKLLRNPLDVDIAEAALLALEDFA
jgi:hypothetical protein